MNAQLLEQVFGLVSQFTLIGGGLILVAAGWFATSFDIGSFLP